ncbi:MAG: SMP-30/gluconolactonase/LRE family protein [Caldilineaceae bacterium SB0670_bin_27]|uniref:SMP-30/gluconolactonase/LRE family protein n=1 Tax=Caldilineaceae bacterium SB0664_bin_27 TaxID=2605260 RepID=A0A6B0YL94_9CHLR|nr:SMP-30/gluconolactonase/LRE family protein [Caldilineaceae bacterium SB0664_bin_27]MYF79555.1 SMP-30/gluconolactonase/LRE family protein [Chloroflexota bacterium]MYJ78881.1 SMP-30/gluconolactonase/LRE family protein [Caldilineaceae bacterium SB0670_bin_27]
MPLINLKHAETFVEGLDHPEGVALGPDGNIYAGGEAGQVYRINYEERSVEEYANTGGLNLGMALDAEANLYMCTADRGAVFKVTPSGEVSEYSSGTEDRPMTTPNYPAFDKQGNLYATNSGSWYGNDGCIYCVAPDGTTAVIDSENSQFPNGCAVSPDGQYLYVAMSLSPPQIIRFPIEDGRKVGPTETIVELPHVVPDGLAFCTDGSFLISCYRPDTILRVLPSGDLTVLMDDYEGTILGAPTNVCFGGPGMSVLFWANLGRWHLGLNAHTGLQGARLFYPDISSA